MEEYDMLFSLNRLKARNEAYKEKLKKKKTKKKKEKE